MKKGFTLIELLVVVLIIGILSAIALPQYQKAVTKAKFTDILIRTRTLAKAQNIYYLANNEFSSDYAALDIDLVPNDTAVTIGGPHTRSSFCYNGGCWFINVAFTTTRKGIYFWGSSSKAQMFPYLFMMFNNTDNDLANKLICCYGGGTGTNAKMQKYLCESLGSGTAPDIWNRGTCKYIE